ncbi:uncharacterized protein [Primulina huaijiensis]|uniref:uncharacterized protein n=1 Tax=Primulina huaijiensis TaxID=1492673 RepID=UPI003CC7512C
MVKGNNMANPQLNRGVSEDSSSPFFLHNGDHPGLLLVSHQLTGSNYNTWSRSFSMALTAKNKLGFIDGDIIRPHINDMLYGAWNRCNSMVISWILNSVSKEIADSLMYLSTAREVWIDLKERFLESNALRIFQIKKLLANLHQGSMDVNIYYTKLRILWDELKDYQPVTTCTCGSMKELASYHNQEYVMQFLMGLNESYTQVRAQVLMLDPLPLISKVFAFVVQEERQRSIGLNSSKAVVDQPLALASPASVITPTPKMFQNMKGGKRDILVCSHCDFSGHTVDKCYKLHGYPPGHPKFNQQQQKGRAYVCQAPAPEPTSSSADSLTAGQCRQLIDFLTTKLQTGAGFIPDSQQHQGPIVSCFNGYSSHEDDWDG